MNRYRVSVPVYFGGFVSVEVEAETKAEAKVKALDEAELKVPGGNVIRSGELRVLKLQRR